MKAYVMEIVGTALLVFTIGMVVVDGSDLAPIAVGVTLTALVYMGAAASGAHYNPAVSIALAVRGVFPAAQVLPYIASQLVGAIVGSLAVRLIAEQGFALAPAAESSTLAVWSAEILFTFALMLVILNVATSTKTKGNSYFGLAIGLVVMGGAFAVGGISGAAFNPAVGVGPILVEAALAGGALRAVPLYIVAPILGALLAVGVFRLQDDSP